MKNVNHGTRIPIVLLWLAGWMASAGAEANDPFLAGVRPTEPLTAKEQATTFKLPPGFEIQLVAAEPDIHKPMNMAFDAAGRLWVTTSIEYPFAAPTNAPGRDRVMIFEDFAPDGKARKVSEFAGGLNIPIGVYPFRSPSRVGRDSVEPGSGKAALQQHPTMTWKCIVWSIPNIWLMEDTDGDGRADKQEVLYGPFDHTRDTHGNQASFRRGNDGWLYATHGFNNDSRVKGRDGHEIHLNSGNTYRMRLDGSRIEKWTHGQVNPFGLAFDPLGNLYSADCHSSPIYQLLRGAYYPSFGKPHDGLGFAPVTIQHSHGSTAICGITYISDPSWPAEFHGNILIGNVMTSRINRDRIEWIGSTSKGHEMPDFLSTDDPWFRPVDLQWGPDGALYVADFYNRIIGHYEVPLTHPGRDRERGRIWRIIYKGSREVSEGNEVKAKHSSPSSTLRDTLPNFTSQSASELTNELTSRNPTRRALAREELALLPDANKDGLLTQAAQGVWHFRQGDEREGLMISCLWLLQRAGQLDEKELLKALNDRDAAVRVHALRILTERGLQAAARAVADARPSSPPVPAGERRGEGERTSHFSASLHTAILAALQDANAHVQRAAADALGVHPRWENVQPLLQLLSTSPSEDTHLRHTLRMALRDQLAVASIMDKVMNSIWPEPELRALADVSMAVKSEKAASFLLKQDMSLFADAATQNRVFEHAARYAPADGLTRLTELATARLPKTSGMDQHLELERQFALFKSADDGLRQRGMERPDTVRQWGTNLVWTFFRALDGYHTWRAVPLETQPTAMPWDMQERACADGRKRTLTSSFPHGESLTGVLRSPDFLLPEKLSFWLCGHNGFPSQPDHQKNVVRLRELGTGVIIAEAYPPRNDTAQRIVWDLSTHQGKRCRVEAVDGDAGRAYAWLAFGGFEPELSALRPSEFPPRKMRDWMIGALDLVGRLQVKELAQQLGDWAAPVPDGNRVVRHDLADPDTLEALGRAWLAVDRDAATAGLARQIVSDSCPLLYRERLGLMLSEVRSPDALAAIVQAFKSVPTRTQLQWANNLASSRDGAEALLSAGEKGLLPGQLFARTGTRNRIQAANPRDWENRLAALVKDLPANTEARQALIDERKAAFDRTKADLGNGAVVFNQTCAVCHQLGGQGALVGPQLDGIGSRGLERVLEDILDPNRNVDHAFRSQIITLQDGDVLSGLLRREEDAAMVVVDATGKEILVEKQKVVSRRSSGTSLMPDNFGELLLADQLRDLVAYLLAAPAAARRN